MYISAHTHNWTGAGKIRRLDCWEVGRRELDAGCFDSDDDVDNDDDDEDIDDDDDDFNPSAD